MVHRNVENYWQNVTAFTSEKIRIFGGTAEREFGYKVHRADRLSGIRSTLLIPKPAIGHDPEPVPSTSHPHNLFPNY
jgi:hypothetical protein